MRVRARRGGRRRGCCAGVAATRIATETAVFRRGAADARVLVAVALRLLAFFPQELGVAQKLSKFFSAMSNIDALVFAPLVDVRKALEAAQDTATVSCGVHHLLGPVLDEKLP